jgi:2-oxoglutarate dehydrogenase complex dehydrogenase (E1) component-like enzyme
MKLRDLLARLKATYTGSIGAEFMHISEVEQRQWIYKKLEAAGGNYQLDADTQRRTLERLTGPKAWSATCTPSTSARSASRWKAATR